MLPDDDRWRAVQQRDRRRDGQFVLAVRTTGIYCRPSCPARMPNRENVSFFADADAAEQAGFRACRRCTPRSPLAPREAMIARATAWLDAHLEERVTLARLAQAVGVSPGHLQRTFTEVTGVSPRQYVAARRLQGAKSRLRHGDDVTTAIYAAGYGSSSRFYAQTRNMLGMTPSSYRRGGAGMTIGFATAESAIGRVLVAATARGICAVSIGEDDAALQSSLTAEFPQATIRRDDDAIRPWLDSVLASLQNRTLLPTLPLDAPGTPFQRQVWNALQAIPAGERRTYGEVAASLGKPDAARAVASACAANSVAIVIPCHRVVRADGETGGYRWGAERKQALLALEGDRVMGC
ncbi:MAG: bifunctional DNA-binding transcriptional regulator/O6-methylguanine-DNA methyltransferase Ada [Chloroflexia bacterium]|nr:bifunctional DNA-binding transcriptional regulator/O6-methylguanine-DNA methyltransferase Ada [Chloroflexia bacterium]